MIVKSFDELSLLQRESFFNWLKEQPTTDPAASNMWDDDWQSKTNTLPYVLLKSNRFVNNNGKFHIAYDNETIAGCAGVYKSSFSPEVALAGTRMWIDNNYRNKLIAREYILPVHKQWARDNNCKQVALCFNEYNKNLITIWKRKRLGEIRSKREQRHMFYSNLHETLYPVTIQHTPQWVIYEKLDESWEFNWDLIKHSS
jgi:hypothetical protein